MIAAATFATVHKLKTKNPKELITCKEPWKITVVTFNCLTVVTFNCEGNGHYLEILNLSDINLIIIIDLSSFKIFVQFGINT